MGCVPIITRPQHMWMASLPFPLLIDWRAFSYFLAPARMSLSHRHKEPPPASDVWSARRAEAAWVQAQLGDSGRVHHARVMALLAFCAHLDPQANPAGTVDAILSSA